MSDNNISEIDKRLNEAKARKAQKNGTAAPEGTEASPNRQPRQKPTDAEKEALKAQRELDRAESKDKRDQAAQARKAQRDAAKQPAHLRKVQRAAERMAPLEQAATLLFNEATGNLTAGELANLALHIQHFNRENATKRALDTKLEVGQQVTIVSGDPRLVGKTGTIVKAQRIRCYVNIPGANNRPVSGSDALGVYMFSSDVTVDAEQAQAAAG